MVLLMTVNPGYGGQSYIPAMTQKIKDMRAMTTQRKAIDLETTASDTSNLQMCLMPAQMSSWLDPRFLKEIL